MSFQANPLTDDLIAIKNETAIARSVKNIVLTSPGEKFFDPSFGSKVKESLFENLDSLTAGVIRSEIRRSIENFEPRVELKEVTVLANHNNGSFDVMIKYIIIGSIASPQQLEFILLPTK